MSLEAKLKQNKLFVEFLDWKIEKPFGTEIVTIPYHLYSPTISEIESTNYSFKNDLFECEFSSNWNWIMEVVSKIETVKPLDKHRFVMRSDEVYYQLFLYDKPCRYKTFFFGDGLPSKTKIDAVVVACEDLINFYNEIIKLK